MEDFIEIGYGEEEIYVLYKTDQKSEHGRFPLFLTDVEGFLDHPEYEHAATLYTDDPSWTYNKLKSELEDYKLHRYGEGWYLTTLDLIIQIGERLDGEIVQATNAFNNIMQFLKDVRIEKGLSQGELGDLIGIYQSQISELESGHHDPQISTVKKIADALGVTLVLKVL